MTDCTAPRHGDQPAPAAPSAALCRPCTSGLRRDLYRIPALYNGLTELLDPLSAGTDGGTGDGLPYHEPASECQDQIRHDLTWWATEAARQRGWQPPADTRIPGLAGWLHAQVGWAAYRDWAGDMAGTFAADRSRAVALIDPKPPTSFIIPDAQNWCPQCEAWGLLRVVRRSLVACGGCGREWDSTQLLRLGRDIIHATEGTAA